MTDEDEEKKLAELRKKKAAEMLKRHHNGEVSPELMKWRFRSDTVVGARYDCCISGIPLQDHKMNKERIFDVVSELDGHLIIKEYPTKSASTNTIKNHIEKLRKRGIEPDMIIVDYGDLLRPLKLLKFMIALCGLPHRLIDLA